MAGLIVFGAISLGKLGISQMPDVDFPLLNINVVWDGAAPEVMEAELIDRIEEKVITVEGIKEIRSNIRQGAGTIEVEFNIHRDLDAALQEVQSAISQIHLPLNVDTPTINKNSTEAEPFMWLSVSGKNQDLRGLVTFVDTFLSDQFQVVPGVGEIRLGGFSERNLRVWVDSSKLRDYELTVLDVQQAIQLQHEEIAGGYIENKTREMNVRTMGEGLTPAQVGDILITRRGSQPIYNSSIHIRDVARVEDSTADVRRISRINDGRLSVSMGISKQRKTNEVEVADRVLKKIEELRPNLPPGMDLRPIVDFSQFTRQVVHHTEQELLVAALLTALICYLFLGSWSSSINVILSIPTSVVGTFTILYFLGFTLNTFTLLALALAIGIIVDDAIMVLENIVRHFQMGKNRVAAARDGAREITFAAIAATIAVIAIFLPVAFMEGIIGKFFFQFGVTITAAVALSLLEAITLTPMRCSQLLQNEDHSGRLARFVNHAFTGLADSYRQGLDFALHHRAWVVLISFLLFGLSLFSASRLRKEFVPSQDQSIMRFDLRIPVGSSLALTNSRVKIIEDYLRHRKDVLNFFSNVGGLNSLSNQATIFCNLVPKNQRTRGQSEILAETRADLAKLVPDVLVFFSDLSTRGLTPRRSRPIEFNLRGPDYAKLDELSRVIMKKLNQTGMVMDLDTDYFVGMPELRIIPDREAAARRGVSIDSIGQTISAALGGVRQGKFTNKGRRYDVRIRLNPEDRMNPDDVKRLQIRTIYGELIPLTDVVKTEVAPTIQTVNRVNRQRSVSISGNLAPGKSQQLALEAAKKYAAEILPPGYSFHFSGGSATFQESFGGLWVAFLLGIVIAYMVLASQFNSFIHPVTVLMALPFSLTGAALTLLFAGQSLNLYSAIGVILLMGIVKKNSILLVEFTNHLRHADKLPVTEALKRACPIRLRPILMTSAATIASAIPSALGTGAGSETRVPMALSIIGGVLVSTCFTLFVVPCIYSLLARFERISHQEEIDRIMSEPAP